MTARGRGNAPGAALVTAALLAGGTTATTQAPATPVIPASLTK